MSEIDFDWVDAQLEKTTLSDEACEIVVDLLEVFDTADGGDNEKSAALDAFINLAKGHSLIADTPEQVWVTVQMGFVHGGDIVRVKHDAFDGGTGKIHNGRVGKVMAARSGDVIFRSTDGVEPFLDGTHYPPAKLERRIR